MAEKKTGVRCEYCGGPTRGDPHHAQLAECVRFLAKVVGSVRPEQPAKKDEG